jgi:hypothetical protein
MFTATILKSSPRYRDWIEVLGTDQVPVESPLPHVGHFPVIGEKQCYAVAVKKLSTMQIDNLVAHMAKRFEVREDEVLADLLGDHGLPILAEDVSVLISLAAFL